jgi:hypothetical protein
MLHGVQYVALLATFALVCLPLRAQQPDDFQQLAGQLKAEFGLTARVAEITKGEVVIVLEMPPADTAKYSVEDRHRFAHHVALFARAHSSRAGSAAFITVRLIRVNDSDKEPVQDLGTWYWASEYIDADSTRPPDLLKGSSPH